MGKKTNLIVGAVSTVAATAILTGCNLYGKEEFTIKFETNGGNPIADLKAGWDDVVSLPSNPTKEGYTFAGWYFNANLEESSKVSDDLVIEGDITVYAKWNINSYKITFDSKGGSAVASVTMNYNSKVEVADPTKEGYEFDGWYLDEKFNTAFDNKIPGENITVYAKWIANVVNVTFDANSDKAVGEINSVTYNSNGTSFKLPKNNFTREGYSFKGWALTSNGKVEYADEADVKDLTKEDQDVTLYAVWEANEYEIRFIHNNETFASIKAGYETTITMPTNKPERNGYSFVNWGHYVLTSDATFQENKVYYTSSGSHYSESEVTVGGSVTADTYYELVEFTNTTMPLNGINLFPIWTVDAYTINFDSDVSSITQNYGTALVLPTPSKTGHTFKGWYVKGTDTLFDAKTMGAQMTSTSIDLAAKWEANTYRLDFNANGGTNSTYQTFTYGVSQALNAVEATRTGYTFKGWSTTQNGEVEYADGASYSIPATNTTLYAVWEINEYTISFDSGVTSITQNYDTDVTLPTPTKTGYTFKGWLLNNEAYSTNKMPAQNVALTAKWEANKYEIYFAANTGTGTTTKVAATYDVAATLTTNAFTKVGYSFAGWNTKEDGTGTSYTDGQSVSNLVSENGGSITLYAKWEANTNTIYHVHFYGYDLNGNPEYIQGYEAKGTSDSTITIELPDFEGFVTPENPQLTIKADGTSEVSVYYERQTYQVTFTGINPETEENIENVVISVKHGGSVESFPASFNVKNYSLVWKNAEGEDFVNTIYGNTTLVAVYERIEKAITVYSEGSLPLNITNVDAGSIILETLEEHEFEREGYEFVGFYLDENFETALEDSAVMPEDSNIEIYVKWEAIEYTISFDEKGGDEVEDIKGNFHDTITLPTIERTGYEFLGWYEVDTNILYNANAMPSKDVALYAKWDANSYQVEFDANNALGTMSNLDCVYDDEDLTLTLNAFSMTGYSFDGWNTKADGSGTSYKDGQAISNLTSEDGAVITLYAQWKINSYTVSLNSDGGSAVTDIKANYGEALNLPTPTKEGHTFDGWFLGEDKYTGTTIPAEDISLVAKWTKNTYTITYDANGGSGSKTQNIEYGKKDNLLQFTFEKEGYHFTGWSLIPNGEIVYGNEAEITMGAENITLYAVWEINEYSYEFYVDGKLYTTSTPIHGETVEVPELTDYKDLSYVYKFDGWYSDSTYTTKTTIDSNGVKDNKYYARYISSAYKVVFQDEYAGNKLFEQAANGKEISFMTYVNQVYAKVEAYDYIYGALTKAIEGQALNTAPTKPKLEDYEGNEEAYTNAMMEYADKAIAYRNSIAPYMADYVMTAVYFGAVLQNANNFNQIKDDSIKVQILMGGTAEKLNFTADEAGVMEVIGLGIDLQTLAMTTMTKLAAFDLLTNPEDMQYGALVTQFSNQTDLVVSHTSDYRKEQILIYNNLKENGFHPNKENKYFDGWGEYIDTETSNVYKYAKWLTKMNTPLNVKVQAINKSSVTYSWNAVTGSELYEVKYTVYNDQGVKIIENKTDRTNLLAFTVKGLQTGYKVELQVCAINPTKEKTDVLTNTGPCGTTITTESVSLNSDYSEVVDYDHTFSSNASVNVSGDYYYVLEDGTFVFFESKYYTFSNVEYMDIIDRDGDVIKSNAAEYLVLSDDENRLNILGTGLLNNEFYFRAYTKAEGEFDPTKAYYSKNDDNNVYQLVENPTSIDGLYIGAKYHARIQSLINGISIGDNLNSYLNTTANINSAESKYMNKTVNTYSVGTSSGPSENITVEKDENGVFSVPSNKGITDYYYNVLVEQTVDTQTYIQYTNGFKFDFEVQANGGAVLDGSQFALDYKFYTLDGNPVDPSSLYYEYDSNSDAFYFKPVTGTYKVVVSPKVDGLYKTTDKVIDSTKIYYDDKGNQIPLADQSQISNYYEKFNNIGLPQAVKNNIKADIDNGSEDGNPLLSKYSKEFTFTLKEGINVYNQSGLKKAYADTDVASIFLHSNIEAEITPDQVIYIEDDISYYQKSPYGQLKLDEEYPVEFTTSSGYGDKVWSLEKESYDFSIKAKDGKTYYFVDDKAGTHAIKDAKWYYDFDKNATKGAFTLMNQYLDTMASGTSYNIASIFTRNNKGKKDGKFVPAENLVVEGNYFTIDGSKLPYINSKYSVSNALVASSYFVQNGATSVFESNSYANTTFRNLEIIGNTSNANNSLNAEGQTRPIKEYMEITSGGYLGIRAEGFEFNSGNTEIINQTSVTTDNIVLRNMLLGFSIGVGSSAEFNNTYSGNNWGNALFGFGSTHITINSAKFEDCGGGAIHIEDEVEGENLNNPVVTINPLNVDIGNYVSGEEPWFKAYAMEVVALGMKSQVEAKLELFKAYGHNFTCLKAIPDETTGLLAEKLNLVYLGRDKCDPEVTHKLEGVEEVILLPEAIPGTGVYSDGQRFYLMFNQEMAGEKFTIMIEIYKY